MLLLYVVLTTPDIYENGDMSRQINICKYTTVRSDESIYYSCFRRRSTDVSCLDEQYNIINQQQEKMVAFKRKYAPSCELILARQLRYKFGIIHYCYFTLHSFNSKRDI
jgi:hypothetical protein